MSTTEDDASAPTPPPAAAAEAVDLLSRLRHSLEQVSLPLGIDGAAESARTRDAAVDQLDDYVLPRYRSLDAPLLAVVGGSTGAGKSTLVNALVGHPVTRSGAIRPTTRQPILLHHPDDLEWFTTARVLPHLSRVRGHRADLGAAVRAEQAGVDPDPAAIGSLVMVAEPSLTVGMALLDAPDIDSIADENRRLAAQLLSAADLWIFVTTANRYADAVPWELLLDAAARDITVAVVLDRVPNAVQAEVGADLRGMLERQGLGSARLFVVTESALDADGMLPAGAADPLRDWLAAIAADAGSRSEVARRTLNGVVRQLADKTEGLVQAEQDQRRAAARLKGDVDSAYEQALQGVLAATQDGTLLRGEVLSRWQDFVGTGEFFRSLESGIGRLRDRLTAFLTGRPAPPEEVETAIETGLHAVLVEQAAAAAEETEQRWRQDAAGRGLVQGRDLAGLPEDFPARAAAQIRGWQEDLIHLIQQEGAGKRTMARISALGVNGVAVTLMIVSFASTGGLLGIEVGIAGGTAVVAQKLLESIFGEDAVRRLARRSQENLVERITELLQTESRRFTQLLDEVPDEAASGRWSELIPALRRLAARREG
ncbi:dynamin family protein [Citricoccus sp. NPDC055426]|uniref:dynamin family protein n=1 Tax=Citricoccus sp. NPDC055426 TaxID=3155536 RepID=UPI003418C479